MNLDVSWDKDEEREDWFPILFGKWLLLWTYMVMLLFFKGILIASGFHWLSHHSL